MPSFDLRVHFVGLMMWVPDPTGAMHVLMPTTEGHNHGAGGKPGGHSGGVHGHQHQMSGYPADPATSAQKRLADAATEVMAVLTAMTGGATPFAAGKLHLKEGDVQEATPPHFVRLAYDVAYEDRTSTQLARVWEMLDLGGRVLDLTGLASSDGFVPDLPDEIASLTAVGAGPVDRTLVQGTPAPPVAARVTMSGGALTDYEIGAPFNFASSDKTQRITPITEWTIRGIPLPDDDSNPLEKLVIRGPGERLPPLYPIGQTIHLTVYHMVFKEFPPHNLRFKPAAGGDDTHFAAYYGIAQTEDGTGPVPLRSDGEEIPVRGAVVGGQGKQNPGSVCGQGQAALA